MTDTQNLLADYVQTGSDTAFRELVARYVDLVYATALRLVDRNAHQAEDVAQTVFVDLAQNARTLSSDVRLGGWLHRHTCFVAMKIMRGERRRQSRERQAVEMNALQENSGADFSQVAPILDEAINELGEADRTAILQRFFEQHDFRSVGQALGSNEDAARMRVTRALDKLQGLLRRRGVTVSAASLAVVISTNVATGAPAGLATTIASAALALATISTTVAATATKTIVMTTLQKTIVAAIVVASVATPLIIHHQTSAKRHAAEEALRQQTDELAKQQAEKDRLTSLTTETTAPDDAATELANLRAQTGELRQQTNSLPKLRSENRRLQAAANAPDVEPSPAEKEELTARMADNKKWIMASFMYARKNQGKFPASLDQIAAASPDSKIDRFEIVNQSLIKTAKPQELIVFRQKESVPYGNKWAKVYSYADGHVEMRTQTEPDFTEWEKEHIPASVAP